MTIAETSDPTEPLDTTLPSPFHGLEGLAARLAAMDHKLSELCGAEARPVSLQARKLRKQIREFEPGITFIGQVKAGKTTLVNALVGRADLLPADVNPWTSVVTSLHLSPTLEEDDRRSSFRFFSNEEWGALIRQGGRVGELASRAGAESELEKVRRQLEEMREKSKARLGRKFQLLLGQTHDYNTFDRELIERYVCLGDDFWDEPEGDTAAFGTGRERGRFADITRSADLWFSAPDTPVNLCIQDTPGVNDTFMIREQITINALRNTRLCVMVLSAQQALSAVDLGLIRLISNLRSRHIIIFVNRIDELNDPVREVPEIRDSIQTTLKRFHGPTDVEILFGSGHWANHAVSGSVDRLGGASAQALLDWSSAHLDQSLAQHHPVEIIWTMSGLPALGQAISERIAQDSGAQLEESVGTALQNLRAGLSAAAARQPAERIAAGACRMSRDQIAARFARIEAQALTTLQEAMTAVHRTFASRTENARKTFQGRASDSLLKHLDLYGDGEVWTYDPAGLRMLLRSAYNVFVHGAGKACGTAQETAANDIAALIGEAFGTTGTGLEAPPLPPAPAPVSLGQTIALDLRGSWWTRFWRRRRSRKSLSDEFARLIHEETVPIVDALRRDCADPYVESLRDALSGFIRAQRDLVTGLAFGEGTPQPVPGGAPVPHTPQATLRSAP